MDTDNINIQFDASYAESISELFEQDSRRFSRSLTEEQEVQTG